MMAANPSFRSESTVSSLIARSLIASSLTPSSLTVPRGRGIIGLECRCAWDAGAPPKGLPVSDITLASKATESCTAAEVRLI